MADPIDHYATLGVPKDASQDDIKHAYRKLARQLHPDVNPSPEAQERFKMVTYAYEVLSDPQRRAEYDAGGRGERGGGFEQFGFGDIFDAFFGGSAQGRGRGPASRQQPGQDALLRQDVGLRDVVFGAEVTVQVETAVTCGTCHGSCCQPGTSPRACDVCHGTGQVQRRVQSLLGTMVTSAPCTRCRGFGSIIDSPCADCSGTGRVRTMRDLTINVPAGVEDGMRLRLQGEGEAGPGGGPNGDLYVEIHVSHDPTFSRSGDDLLCTLQVPFADAALGAETTVDTFDGPLSVTIRAGAQSGDVVTIRGRGVGRLRGNGRGDLRIALQVITPERLTTKQRRLVEEFAASRRDDAPRLAEFKQGLFAKLRDRFTG